MIEGLRRKTILMQIKVTSGSANYDLCVAVETLLKATVLNAAEFDLEFVETKVIKDEPTTDPRPEGVS